MELSEKCKKVIELILGFKDDLERLDPNEFAKYSTTLIGEIGEQYALQKLSDFNPVPKGGQSGYDIQLNKGENVIKIEVRTSKLKNDIYPRDKDMLYWGWRLQRRNITNWELEPIKADCIICITLDKAWKEPKFLVFSREEIESQEENPRKGRFKAVAKSVYLFEHDYMFKKALEMIHEQFINKLTCDLNRNSQKYFSEAEKWFKNPFL